MSAKIPVPPVTRARDIGGLEYPTPKVRVIVGWIEGPDPAVIVIENPVCVPELTCKLAPVPHPENEKFPATRGVPGAFTNDTGRGMITQSGRLSTRDVILFSEVVTVAIGITWFGKPEVFSRKAFVTTS